MNNEQRLEQKIYTLTRKQALLVMCLVELVDGAESYIDDLHEKLGITGKEGYDESQWADIDATDKRDRLKHSIERWDLHNELHIAHCGEPSVENNRMIVIDGGKQKS